MVKQVCFFIKQHCLMMLLLFCVTFGGIILAAMSNGLSADHTKIEVDSPTDFSDGWVLTSDGQSAPLRSFASNGMIVVNSQCTITTDYPVKKQCAGLCLYFRSKNIKYRVFADDTLVFSYTWNSDGSAGKSFGLLENLIQLPASSASVLRIELSPQNPKVAGTLFATQLGSRDSVVLQLLRQKAFCIFVCILLLLLGVGLCICSVVQRARHLPPGTLLSLGLGVLMVAIWLSTETLLPQFFIPNKSISYLLANLTFLLLPVPFLLFLQQICPQYSRILTVCGALQCGYALLRLTCYVADWMDFNQLEFISHLPMLINLAICIVICFRERHNRDAKNVLIAMTMLCFSALLSIVNYWSGRDTYTDFVFIGILLFILILIAGIAQRGFLLQKQAVRAEFYKRCAYTDLMTEMENRASYERRLQHLQKESKNRITILLFDLNNLKETNDTLGHNEGDRLIRRLAGCLHRAFDSCAKNYRIGGDEFVTVFTDSENLAVDRALADFYAASKEANLGEAVGLSVAVGRAFSGEPGFSGTVIDLVALADARMYSDKRAIESAESAESGFMS